MPAPRTATLFSWAKRVVSARSLTPLLLALSIFLVSCNDDAASTPHTPSPDAAQPTTTSVPPDTPASPACTPARPHQAGNTTATLASGGRERTYILHIPESYDGSAAVPLVLNLHGAGSNATEQTIYSKVQALAAGQGFIAVMPDATAGPGGEQAWRFLPGDDTDTAFITALLDQLEAQLCIDSARVYAIGISSGAAMSSRLACALPERITAVGLVAALVFFRGCAADPTPVIAFHGTGDLFVPFEGGLSVTGLPVRPAKDAAADWAALNGCNPAPAESQVSEHVDAVAYSECSDEVAVILYVIDGGGHTWPGAIEVPRLGPTTREIDATTLMWEFFAAQARQRRP